MQDRRPGKALDFGMGSGRNSIFLAQHGWDVTGFDVADEGISAAKKDAEQLGVRLNALVANAKTFDLGRQPLGLDCRHLRGRTDIRIVKALRPGGLLVIEDYLWDAAERKREKPPDTVGPNDLLEKYRKLRIIHSGVPVFSRIVFGCAKCHAVDPP